MIRERAATEKWDGLLIVDAGDAFSPTPSIVPSRREAMVATAEFLVDQYSASQVAAMTVGDRDLALGLDTVVALAKRAKFPFVSANLVNAETKAPIFPTHVIVERAGLKIGILGLMSPSGAQNTVANIPNAEGKAPWEATDPVKAATAAVAALADEGADVVVALSHLAPEEQAAVSKAVPAIRVFIGGQSMGMRSPASAVQVGSVAVEGGMKGKQVGLLTLHLAAGTATNAPIVDKDQKKVLEDRLARTRVRVDSLEKRIAMAKAKADAPEPKGAPSKPPTRRIQPPLSLWEQQLAGTKAEMKMIEADLAALADAPDTAGNTTRFQLVNLGNDVEDDPAVKAAVDAFREKVPEPTKQPPPGVRHPAQGMEIPPPGSAVRVPPGPGVKPVPPVRRVVPIKPPIPPIKRPTTP